MSRITLAPPEIQLNAGHTLDLAYHLLSLVRRLRDRVRRSGEEGQYHTFSVQRVILPVAPALSAVDATGLVHPEGSAPQIAAMPGAIQPRAFHRKRHDGAKAACPRDLLRIALLIRGHLAGRYASVETGHGHGDMRLLVGVHSNNDLVGRVRLDGRGQRVARSDVRSQREWKRVANPDRTVTSRSGRLSSPRVRTH
jgi:hypothetical protein